MPASVFCLSISHVHSSSKINTILRLLGHLKTLLSVSDISQNKHLSVKVNLLRNILVCKRFLNSVN